MSKQSQALSPDELEEALAAIAAMESQCNETDSESCGTDFHSVGTATTLESKQAPPGAIASSMCGPTPWISITQANPLWKARNAAAGDHNTYGNVCVRECGGGGDCMFHAIATVMFIAFGASEPHLFPHNTPQGRMQTVRGWMADSVTVDNVREFLHGYQQEKFSSEMNRARGLPGSWPTDPATWNPDVFGTSRPLVYHDAKTKKDIHRTFQSPQHAKLMDPHHPQFKLADGVQFPDWLPAEMRPEYSANWLRMMVVQALIKSTGYTFQGDTQALEHLVKSRHTPLWRHSIGFLVLTSAGTIDCLIYPHDETRDYYAILYWLGNHWILGGIAVAPNTVQSLFPRRELPQVIRQLFTEDCGALPEKLQ